MQVSPSETATFLPIVTTHLYRSVRYYVPPALLWGRPIIDVFGVFNVESQPISVLFAFPVGGLRRVGVVSVSRFAIIGEFWCPIV